MTKTTGFFLLLGLGAIVYSMNSDSTDGGNEPQPPAPPQPDIDPAPQPGPQYELPPVISDNISAEDLISIVNEMPYALRT